MSETKLEIQLWPSAILRRPCRPVTEINDHIRQTLEEMRCLMNINNGIGLAANQAGLDLALVVIEGKDFLFKLVNPRIVKKEGRNHIVEGCLSFPGIELDVKRANKVWIEAQDEYGKNVKLEADGVLAIVFQHEIDHINGISFIERVPFWRRWQIIPKLRMIAHSVERTGKLKR